MKAETNAVPSYTGRTALAGVAAIASVIAASSCCLPILPFIFAASLAGSASVLTALRPYLLGASVLFIAYGFYQARQSRKCSRKPNVISSAILWLSAFFVFVSIFFPQVLANAAANILAR
jgi:heme O synthase-like polyprenyltransferase